jgi:hypothetical protein
MLSTDGIRILSIENESKTLKDENIGLGNYDQFITDD